MKRSHQARARARRPRRARLPPGAGERRRAPGSPTTAWPPPR
nr:hypothetical protein [Angustibacter aerolatus]